MKQSVISQMTTEELKEQVYEYQRSLEKLKSTHAITPLENPSEIRNKRRSIARMLTEISKRNNQVA
ncbi:MAG: 50S ribosomal protein L29 [Thermaurantimonas sp.]